MEKGAKSGLNKRALAKYRRRFLQIFPRGFYDEQYLLWEHNYKDNTHKLWNQLLNKKEFEDLVKHGKFSEVAERALKIEASCKPPFLFSFEKMALRDALRTEYGARVFALGLFNLLHGKAPLQQRFIEWIIAVADLPRKQSRVLSWPILTFFPYMAEPKKFMIMKPQAMKAAAAELGFDLQYNSKPGWATYERLLKMSEATREAIADLKPRNYHDVQTFLWVIGSPEYEGIAEELGIT